MSSQHYLLESSFPFQMTELSQLKAGPVGEDDLEGVGPIRGVGSPTATALLPPGPEEEGETGRGGRGGTGELLGLVEA